MSEEPQENTGQPPAPVLYAVYAVLFLVLLGTLIAVGIYAG